MISKIDSAIIIIYILGLLVIGWFLGKENKDQEDYFLAGRSMPWLPIGLSVAATMISANSFVGAPGWAYNAGIAPFMVNIGVPLAIFFVVYTTIPVLYHLKLTSIYEYVEKRLGISSRMLTVIGFLVNSIIQISSMVFVPALILQRITGWDLKLIVPIVVLSSIIYTLLGGIKAVIWTDAVQMVIMWCGLIFSMGLILKGIGMGFFETIAVAKESGKLAALDFSLDISKTNAFWASLFGGTVMWIRYFGFDQGQVQRILTAKSIRGVKNSFMVSAFIMNILYFLFLTIGILLFVFYKGKEFTSSNDIMIDFIVNHLPVGVVGLVIAGAFAAAMSSIDSLLNSMSTVFVKDIYERFFSKNHQEASLKMSMTVSAVWGVVIIIFTLLGFSGTTKSVLETVGSYISYISGPMCGAFFLALFTTKANDKGVTGGVVLGFFITLMFGKYAGASWIWKPAVGLVSTYSVGYLLSLILPSSKTEEEIKEYTVLGLRKKLLDSGLVEEDGVSIVPLKMDKYTWTLLIFFLSQYIFLMIINL
ncbi:sodium:solute symporter [uncultured Ilyobacter sp.]|uniref:sodium:solute symporter n=1 Tax=uncultured Ilyobacter sp. TaxID=544433 RepID=UPI0029C0A26F|nr:sodium:solute symporter [uncultured Ilyobacter sp.]